MGYLEEEEEVEEYEFDWWTKNPPRHKLTHTNPSFPNLLKVFLHQFIYTCSSFPVA